MSIKELDRIVDSRAGFTKVHVVAMLLALANGLLGRAGLMDELGLNEASVKTVTRRLKKYGYVQPSTKGQVLTKRGSKFVDFWSKKCKGPIKINGHELSTGKIDCAILVKGAMKKVGDGQSLRDEAIKAGAAGSSLVVVGEVIEVPFCDVTIESFEEEIKRIFNLERGDAVIITSGRDYRIARNGVLAAVISLLD